MKNLKNLLMMFAVVIAVSAAFAFKPVVSTLQNPTKLVGTGGVIVASNPDGTSNVRLCNANPQDITGQQKNTPTGYLCNTPVTAICTITYTANTTVTPDPNNPGCFIYTNVIVDFGVFQDL